jgi:hypothetical protein
MMNGQKEADMNDNEMMHAGTTIIAWNPGTDQIKAGYCASDDWPVWVDAYAHTSAPAFLWLRTASDERMQSRLKADFIAIVFRDGVCPKAAYREFMKIQQFRDAVPEDMPDNCILFQGDAEYV